MPNIVTGIGEQNDSNGNHHLEVTAEDGTKFEVLLPLEMETLVRVTLQENKARRAAKMSTSLGMMILDVTGCRPAFRKQTGEATLVIDTPQFGMWGLRVDAPMARALIDCLKKILKPRDGGMIR